MNVVEAGSIKLRASIVPNFTTQNAGKLKYFNIFADVASFAYRKKSKIKFEILERFRTKAKHKGAVWQAMEMWKIHGNLWSTGNQCNLQPKLSR